MVYLNLHNTAGSDFVSPVTALDGNWDIIDSKFHAIDSRTAAVGTGVVSPETGMEFVASGLATPDIGVWDSAAYDKINTIEVWGAWQNITLATNYTAAGGRTPRLRVSNLGRVECRGAVQYLGGTAAWTTLYNTINSGQFANTTFGPDARVILDVSAGPITGTTSTSWAYGQARITSDADTTVHIELIYVGAVAASGNFLDLSNLSWYID